MTNKQKPETVEQVLESLPGPFWICPYCGQEWDTEGNEPQCNCDKWMLSQGFSIEDLGPEGETTID